MTHLLDTSAVLAQALDEPGAGRVESLLRDPNVVSGVSVITLFEVWTAYLHHTGSSIRADQAVENLRQAVAEVVPVSEAIVDLARGLRGSSASRIALADCLIAATAAYHRAVLVHRDPHFSVLTPGNPQQEALPDKAPIE